MKEIDLTKDFKTLVDEEDFLYLSSMTWSAYRVSGRGRNGKVYLYGHKAGRKIKQENGKYKRLWMHNFIMNPKKGEEVDHIDGDTLNNTKNNLRLVSHKLNCFNRGKRKNGHTSIFLGVNKRGNKFRAAITNGGKRFFLGSFRTEIQAAEAYNKKAKELFGEFARLNVY